MDSSRLLWLDGRQYGKIRNNMLIFYFLHYRHSVVFPSQTVEFLTCSDYLKTLFATLSKTDKKFTVSFPTSNFCRLNFAFMSVVLTTR